MKKVLHVTNWYPNPWNCLDGLFIQQQIAVFSQRIPGHTLHVQVRESEYFLRYQYIRYSTDVEGYYLLTRCRRHCLIEILSTVLLLWALYRQSKTSYQLIHVHIAYPLLRYVTWWRQYVNAPLLISEHWSAYHFHFYLPPNSPKLRAIKQIFDQSIPLIGVSQSLINDIIHFAGHSDFAYCVIANRVQFTPNPLIKEQHSCPHFFIVNNWQRLKNPFPLLNGCLLLKQQGRDFKLYIGGDGVLIHSMHEFVTQHNLQQHIIFLGPLSHQAVLDWYHRCDAYLCTSVYETFSIACAEALCSGLPLICTVLPAVFEYARKEDVIVVKEASAKYWLLALSDFIHLRWRDKRHDIANYYQHYFSDHIIAEQYYHFISSQFTLIDDDLDTRT